MNKQTQQPTELTNESRIKNVTATRDALRASLRAVMADPESEPVTLISVFGSIAVAAMTHELEGRKITYEQYELWNRAYEEAETRKAVCPDITVAGVNIPKMLDTICENLLRSTLLASFILAA